MKISEQEKNYISKIYQHGISHLVDDSIPNRLICIHNLHWCAENLLRKATKDWNIDYRDGFEEIFKKFISKKSIPKNLEKSIFNLNTIRNDAEHREIYCDILSLRKIIPDVEDFIKWIIRVIFKDDIDLFSVTSADEDKILDDFNNWINKKLENNNQLTRDKMGLIFDYFFVCIIPATYSSQLVDFNFNGVNQMISSTARNGITRLRSNPEHHPKIETYFRNFRHLLGDPAQLYTVPDHLKYCDELGVSEMKIFPDGRIYLCYPYTTFNPKQPSFNPESLFKGSGTIFTINEKTGNHYELPLNEYKPQKLEDILKIICFPFKPNCKEKLVLNPTEYFTGIFILPNMRFEGKNRILLTGNGVEQIFNLSREYGGDEDDIFYKITFKYEDIPKIVKNLKNRIFGFFRKKQDTSFG